LFQPLYVTSLGNGETVGLKLCITQSATFFGFFCYLYFLFRLLTVWTNYNIFYSSCYIFFFTRLVACLRGLFPGRGAEVVARLTCVNIVGVVSHLRFWVGFGRSDIWGQDLSRPGTRIYRSAIATDYIFKIFFNFNYF